MSSSSGSSHSWENIFNEEDEEFKEENEADSYFSNKDCIIFCIDCQPPMFVKNEDGEIPFDNAIKCAISTLTDKIISSENDLIAVCFYGTREKRNPNDFDSIYLLVDLDTPDAKIILELETLLSKQETFMKRFGHSSNKLIFADVLWTCSTIFSLCQVKVGHKRIFLFTNDDNPNRDDIQLREQSLQRARDLSELGIDIELFSMNQDRKQFNAMLFYQYVISHGDDENDDQASLSISSSSSSKFEELRSRVRKKEFKKRALTRLSLFIGDSIEIALRLYSLVHETKKSSFIWLDSKDNQPLKSVTKYICEDTGTLLILDNQIKYSYGYGGERIIFDKEQLANIKTLDRQGLRLMGFKSYSALKLYHNIRSSNFIYPDEQSIKGSTVAFSSLLESMLALGKIAICRLTPRSNSAPCFVALLPQEEEFEDDGTQKTPPGFHLIYLPFADDIRHISTEPIIKANLDQIIAAKKMTRALRIKFDSRNFENPALQKHYAALQAMALEREYIEPVEDLVKPDEEGMRKYASFIEDFKDIVFPIGYVPLLKKRKAENISEPKQSVDEFDVKQAIKTNSLKKYTISELKSVMRNHGIQFNSKMKKDDLIKQIKESSVISTPSDNANSFDSVTTSIGHSIALEHDRIMDTNEMDNSHYDIRPHSEKMEHTQRSLEMSSNRTDQVLYGKNILLKDENREILSVGNSSSITFENSLGEFNSNDSRMVLNSYTHDSLYDDSNDEEDHNNNDEEEQSLNDRRLGESKNMIQKDSNSTNSSVVMELDCTYDSKLPLCMYGSKCYRKNPQHLKDFRHQ